MVHIQKCNLLYIPAFRGVHLSSKNTSPESQHLSPAPRSLDRKTSLTASTPKNRTSSTSRSQGRSDHTTNLVRMYPPKAPNARILPSTLTITPSAGRPGTLHSRTHHWSAKHELRPLEFANLLQMRASAFVRAHI